MVDWTKKAWIPRANLLAWHQYEEGVSTHNFVNDYSDNNRDLVCGAGNAPVLTANIVGGQPAWYFNGTRDPLKFTGSVTVRNAFVLAAFQDASFTTFGVNQGLLTGATSGDLLVSNSTGDTFFDFSYPQFEYRKADVVFANNDQKAPMSSAFQWVELIPSGGHPMDGIQVGQQRTIAGRLLKGWFVEQFLYSTVPTPLRRQLLIEYGAMRYKVWPRNAAGLYVFPFVADKMRSEENEQETYLSEPYEGDPKALVRGGYESTYSLPFSLREQEEYEAAKAFRQQHGRTTKFVIRDYRYYPYKEVTVRFASPIREQGSSVSYRFNYSFDVVEAA